MGKDQPIVRRRPARCKEDEQVAANSQWLTGANPSPTGAADDWQREARRLCGVIVMSGIDALQSVQFVPKDGNRFAVVSAEKWGGLNRMA
jgi:hypothetical protein